MFAVDHIKSIITSSSEDYLFMLFRCTYQPFAETDFNLFFCLSDCFIFKVKNTKIRVCVLFVLSKNKRVQ